MSHVSTLMLILRPHVENFLSARGRYFFRVSEHHRYLCFDDAKIRNFQALCKLFFKKDTKKSTLEKKVQFGTDGRWQFLFRACTLLAFFEI